MTTKTLKTDFIQKTPEKTRDATVYPRSPYHDSRHRLFLFFSTEDFKKGATSQSVSTSRQEMISHDCSHLPTHHTVPTYDCHINALATNLHCTIPVRVCKHSVVAHQFVSSLGVAAHVTSTHLLQNHVSRHRHTFSLYGLTAFSRACIQLRPSVITSTHTCHQNLCLHSLALEMRG